MRLGFVISIVMHTAMLAWAVIGMVSPRALPPLPEPPVPVEVISISELTRITKGRLDAKQPPVEANEDRPTPAKEQAKPKVAPSPPPPPPPAAPPPPPKVEAPPDPPPPAKAEPTPDPIASKIAALEPPGPDPAEVKRLEEERKAEDARKADAARKAAADAKRKADEKRRADLKRKQDEQKRKADEERKRKEAEAKSKANFDADRLSALLDKMPSAAPPPATKSETPVKTPPKGPGAGAPDGKDRVLSAREIDIIRSRMRERLKECWTVNAGADGADQIRVEVEVKFAKDGRVVGQPRVVNSSSSPLFRDFAESAVRALFKCQPFDFLPADKYDGGWEHMIIAFSLRDMF